MARTDPQVNLRIPADLKARIDQASQANSRSMNAEIVARLQASFEQDMRLEGERRKLEILALYMEWCRANTREPGKGCHEFATEYNEQREAFVAFYESCKDPYDSAATVQRIDPRYLSELYGVWAVERDGRFPGCFVSSRTAAADGQHAAGAPALLKDPEAFAELVAKKLKEMQAGKD